MGGPVVLLYGARHPGHAAGLVVQSGFARWDPGRLVEGFRWAAGDQVAEIARRSYAGEPVSDEAWGRALAAFGPHLRDEERRARTPKNLDLNSHGMELIRRLDILDQLRHVQSPTLVSVGELDPVTPVVAAEEITGPATGHAKLEVSRPRATSPGCTAYARRRDHRCERRVLADVGGPARVGRVTARHAAADASPVEADEGSHLR